MKIALDPFMIRRTPLNELPERVARLGFNAIELSPRDDFLPFYSHPRADLSAARGLRRALGDAGVELASVLPLYRWASPDEDERVAAMRYWRRAIQLTVESGCHVMNSELSGRPESPAKSEAQFWKSMEELLPIFEREGISLRLEPHPDDFIEDGIASVDFVRSIDSSVVSYLYCAPHTFHMGGDAAAIIRHAGNLLTHVHLADTLDHRASSGNRIIVNPPGSRVRVHQHLDIGQGEVDFGSIFAALNGIGFDGILTSCVFAWEERADESSRFMREEIGHLVDRHLPGTHETVPSPRPR